MYAIFILLLTFISVNLAYRSTVNSSHAILDKVRQVNADQQPERFIIQFQANTNEHSAVKIEQDAFLSYLQENSVNFTIRYRYTDVMNAISIEINPSLLADHKIETKDRFKPSRFLSETVELLPYVEKYWPGRKYARPRAFRSTASLSHLNISTDGEPNLHAAHDMTGVTFAKSLNLTGKGIKIGILDTGVDYTHPSLGGCFGDACLIKYGYDLVGDQYDGNRKPMPDNDPMDSCDGHGTHVTGILSAKDTQKGFEGVAPGVEAIGICIFGCAGDTNDDIILRAVDMAMKDGMDIINLSLGDGLSSWQEDAVAVAMSNVVDKGIVVVVAQGNEGKEGIARSPSPSIGKHVLAVASVDNSAKWTQFININDPQSNESSIVEYLFSKDSKSDFNKTMTMTHFHAQNTSFHKLDANQYACHQIHQNVTGTVLLVQRGKCSFGKKALNAQQAGAAGVFVYNKYEAQDLPSISMSQYSRVTIPVGAISYKSGLHLLNLLNSAFLDQPVYLNVSFHSGMIPVETGGMASRFSTWGPDPELHFKPDISAVGGYIYSTFPVDLGGYSMMSGTSMATPYLTGCIALYMEATGVHSPLEIYQAFINHAKPLIRRDTLESPIKQGSGLIQLDRALTSRTTIAPFKLALNDTEFFSNNKTLKIHNTSKQLRVYHFRHVPSIAYSGYQYSKSNIPIDSPIDIEANATVKFGNQSFTLKGNETLNARIDFELPRVFNKEENHIIYGGFLQLDSTSINDGGATERLHIPYFGSLGRQRDLKLFDTKNGYPYIESNQRPKSYSENQKLRKMEKEEEDVTLVRLQDKHYHASNISTVLKYNFSRGNTLYLRNRLGSPTAELVSELLDMDNVTIGKLPRVDDFWLSRQDNSHENYDTEYRWYGQVLTSSGLYKVPKGLYKIKLSALKILGDKANPQDWENWYSPKIQVTG